MIRNNSQTPTTCFRALPSGHNYEFYLEPIDAVVLPEAFRFYKLADDLSAFKHFEASKNNTEIKEKLALASGANKTV